MSIENVMIAANANTVFKAMDYDRETKLVAYAASNSVLILDPYHDTVVEEGKILATPKVLFGLSGHTTRINAVQWLTPELIVSIGGDEKAIIVWQKTAGESAKSPGSWQAACKLTEAHPATINYLTTFKADSALDPLYFTTMCLQGVLKLWVSNFGEDGKIIFSVKSELLFGRNL